MKVVLLVARNRITRRSLSIAVPIVLWFMLTTWSMPFSTPLERLPTPSQVMSSLASNAAGSLWLDIGASLFRIGAGFALAAVGGLAVGLMVARSNSFGDLTVPLLEVLRPIPAISVVPLAILVFPNGESAMIAITSASAFFPIYVSVRHSAKSLPINWEDMVLTLGASRCQILRKVMFPAILPGFFSGMSVGLGVAWVCLISAEMISGQLGVGYRTWLSYTLSDYPGVVAGILEIAMLGLSTSAVIEWLGRRCTRWLPQRQTRRRAPYSSI